MVTESSMIELTGGRSSIEVAGAMADELASAGVFDDYRSRKSANTLRRQLADLDLFARYMGLARIVTTGAALQSDPVAWRGMTWGLIESFKRWMLLEGYAVGSVNVRLSTIRVYAKLAHKAGILDAEHYTKIAHVDGYSYKDGANVDQQRDTTRRGAKKAEPVSITSAQVKALKTEHDDTPQGRRDRLIMTLLLDHGLRCGELADLTVGAFDLSEGTFTFWREKVKREQTHTLTRDALRAARAYFNTGDAPAFNADKLLRASSKTGKLTAVGMTRRAITKRVEYLGRTIADVDGLSAHDGRHSWATRAVRSGTQMDRLQDAGGWSSIAMPARYIEAAAIANQGVTLGED